MNIQIPDKLEFLFKPKQIKILFGGRGGYKTTCICKALIFRAMAENLKILCLREYMKSIANSVHSALVKEIDIFNARDKIRVLDKSLSGIQNKSLFAFDGMSRGTKGIKSYDDFNIAWIEEGESTKETSLDDLIPTIIRNNPGEIWISFNPQDESDIIYSRYVKPHIDIINKQGFYEDETLYVCKTSLEENPFPNPGLEEHSRDLKKENYKKWLWMYGGECYADYQDAIIKPEWFDAAVNAHKKLGFKVAGVRSQGFDLADTGDAKCTMHRHGSYISNGERWEWGELPEAIDNAFKNAEKDKDEFMVYDATGMGAAMKVYLANVTINKSIKVIPFMGAESVDNPHELYPKTKLIPDDQKKSNKDTFRNKRSQYYILLADRFEATYNAIEKGIYTNPEDLIAIDPDLEDIDILKSELIKVKKDKKNNSFIQIQSKKDAVKEGIKSPNMADALCMCFANPPPTITRKPLVFASEFVR
jgi:phage terminase large subunit